MTRKRVGQGLVEAFSEECPTCKGRGFILHDEPTVSSEYADPYALKGGDPFIKTNKYGHGTSVEPAAPKPKGSSADVRAKLARIAAAAASMSVDANDVAESSDNVSDVVESTDTESTVAESTATESNDAIGVTEVTEATEVTDVTEAEISSEVDTEVSTEAASEVAGDFAADSEEVTQNETGENSESVDSDESTEDTIDHEDSQNASTYSADEQSE